MPFTKSIDREKVEKYRRGETTDTSDWAVGDFCYYYYKPMVNTWKQEERWTTGHYIHQLMERDISILEDELQNHIQSTFLRDYIREERIKDTKNKITAYKLAWQVFFIKYLWEYEKKMIETNGDI